jgi:hypothetical protein
MNTCLIGYINYKSHHRKQRQYMRSAFAMSVITQQSKLLSTNGKRHKRLSTPSQEKPNLRNGEDRQQPHAQRQQRRQ